MIMGRTSPHYWLESVRCSMANSTFIGNAKSRIIKDLIKDPLIVKAIDSPTIDESTPEKLINTHIFNFHQNP